MCLAPALEGTREITVTALEEYTKQLESKLRNLPEQKKLITSESTQCAKESEEREARTVSQRHQGSGWVSEMKILRTDGERPTLKARKKG